MKIIVYHGYFGCETGCCGHWVVTDEPINGRYSSFDFFHPYRKTPEELREWAEKAVANAFGEEHVKDLDWKNSVLLDD
jgi:hypothetical protein